ncbi:MAG: membrane protein insertase YidC, partial [Desulfuromonadales bacterium]|nr:membrane protein insertase YidC [Desulfuromonadales bacterium]NIR33180.1 membrane protein insertase YidC [Desulfuromonadales bacterium]NIS39404.1 membrane protein insertase YidC [Desulfuromonadales bacterium]
MENKNTLIALMLIMAIWFGYTLLFPPQPPGDKEAAMQSESPVAEAGAGEASSGEKKSPAAGDAALDAAPIEAAPADAVDVVIDSDIYRVVLTSSGARIKEFTLKQYRQTSDKDAPPVQLTQEGPAQFYTMKTQGTEGLSLPANAPFRLQGEATDLQLGNGESRQVHFAAVLDSGAVVHKVFTFHADKYHFDVEVR